MTTIHLTQAHIDAALAARKEGQRATVTCPVSQALRVLLSGDQYVATAGTTAHICTGTPAESSVDDEFIRAIHLPPIACDVIRRFDANETISPCSFEVAL